MHENFPCFYGNKAVFISKWLSKGEFLPQWKFFFTAVNLYTAAR